MPKRLARRRAPHRAQALPLAWPAGVFAGDFLIAAWPQWRMLCRMKFFVRSLMLTELFGAGVGARGQSQLQPASGGTVFCSSTNRYYYGDLSLCSGHFTSPKLTP